MALNGEFKNWQQSLVTLSLQKIKEPLKYMLFYKVLSTLYVVSSSPADPGCSGLTQASSLRRAEAGFLPGKWEKDPREDELAGQGVRGNPR